MQDSKEELLAQFRDINVSHDWWEFTYEDFKNEMAQKGVVVDDIFFSGFWSQGDGACFTGTVSSSNFKLFMEAFDLHDKFSAAYYFAQSQEVYMNIVHQGYYSHENTMSVQLHDYTGNPYGEEDGLRYETYDTMQTLFNEDFDALEDELQELMQNEARKLYRRLEKEYEYLTSDEVVWETIEANDLRLQHEGE